MSSVALTKQCMGIAPLNPAVQGACLNRVSHCLLAEKLILFLAEELRVAAADLSFLQLA